MIAAAKFCKAREAMDKMAVRPFLTDSTISVDMNGVSRPYKRGESDICEFEKRTNTIWEHEILCANDNVVTVVAKETSDFYNLLNLGAQIEVLDLHMYEGKVAKLVMKTITTYKSSQNVEYSGFKRWLFSQKNISEPELIKPDSTLYFTGKSAPRMVFWLQKWRQYSDSISTAEMKR